MTEKRTEVCPTCGCSIEVEADADLRAAGLLADVLTHWRNAHAARCGHAMHQIPALEIVHYGLEARARVHYTLGRPFENVEEAPEPAMKSGSARKRTPRRKRPA